MKIRLNELRERLSMTLEQMAERLNVSVSTVSRWENGKAGIPSYRLIDLARGYECSVGDIFVKDENEPPIPELTAEQLTAMLEIAQSEIALGTVYADWPRAVATNLLEQLRQIQAAGGIRVTPAPHAPQRRGALSRGPKTQGDQG